MKVKMNELVDYITNISSKDNPTVECVVLFSEMRKLNQTLTNYMKKLNQEHLTNYVRKDHADCTIDDVTEYMARVLVSISVVSKMLGISDKNVQDYIDLRYKSHRLVHQDSEN